MTKIPEIVEQEFHDSSLPAPSRDFKSSFYYFDQRKPPSLLKPQEIQPNPPVENELVKELAEQNKTLKQELRSLLEKSNQATRKYEHERQHLLNELQVQQKDSENSKKILVLESKIQTLQIEIEQYKETIKNTKESLELVDDRLGQTTRRLEKSVKSNRILVDKLQALDSSLSTTHQKYIEQKQQSDNLELWIREKKIQLDDYESALRESKCFDDLLVTCGDVLTRYIKNINREKKELVDRNRLLDSQVLDLKTQLNSLTQKYTVDVETKKQQIHTFHDRQRNDEEMIERLEEQLRESQKDNLKLSLQNSKLKEEKEILVRRHEEEVTEVVSKSTHQLKTLREQFESDRCELRLTIEQLQTQKVDLQAEVGHLLRDKRIKATKYTPRLYKFT